MLLVERDPISLLFSEVHLQIERHQFDLLQSARFRVLPPLHLNFKLQVGLLEVFIPGLKLLHFVEFIQGLLTLELELHVPLIDFLHVKLHLRGKIYECDVCLFC